MTLPLAAIWRISRRDLSARIRGLRLLAICLFLGVATLAAIGSLTAGISDELSRRGQTILGGDIEIGIAQREANAAEMAAMRKAGAVSETIRCAQWRLATTACLRNSRPSTMPIRIMARSHYAKVARPKLPQRVKSTSDQPCPNGLISQPAAPSGLAKQRSR